MNREEARKQMQEGHKVTHKSFTTKEYLYIKNGVVYSEEGYDFSETFEQYRFDDGWKIYTPKCLISLACAALSACDVEAHHFSREAYCWKDVKPVEKPNYNEYGNKRNIYKLR